MFFYIRYIEEDLVYADLIDEFSSLAVNDVLDNRSTLISCRHLKFKKIKLERSYF